ncbi:hypothetical protein CGRA01v4_04068 [Colletotrichum graminicola]|nr:hypothetical protein CGRA01v4_04068 [Colletotrichum graminicola]
MTSNVRCPGPSSLPSFVDMGGVPSNVSTGFVPVGRNGSHEAMTKCCSPEVVNIASDCYYWCELPKSELDGFGSCLSRNGIGSGISGTHESSSGRSTTRGSLVGVGLWVLLVTSVLS